MNRKGKYGSNRRLRNEENTDHINDASGEEEQARNNILNNDEKIKTQERSNKVDNNEMPRKRDPTNEEIKELEKRYRNGMQSKQYANTHTTVNTKHNMSDEEIKELEKRYRRNDGVKIENRNANFSTSKAPTDEQIKELEKRYKGIVDNNKQQHGDNSDNGNNSRLNINSKRAQELTGEQIKELERKYKQNNSKLEGGKRQPRASSSHDEEIKELEKRYKGIISCQKNENDGVISMKNNDKNSTRRPNEKTREIGSGPTDEEIKALEKRYKGFVGNKIRHPEFAEDDCIKELENKYRRNSKSNDESKTPIRESKSLRLNGIYHEEDDKIKEAEAKQRLSASGVDATIGLSASAILNLTEQQMNLSGRRLANKGSSTEAADLFIKQKEKVAKRKFYEGGAAATLSASGNSREKLKESDSNRGKNSNKNNTSANNSSSRLVGLTTRDIVELTREGEESTEDRDERIKREEAEIATVFDSDRGVPILLRPAIQRRGSGEHGPSNQLDSSGNDVNEDITSGDTSEAAMYEHFEIDGINEDALTAPIARRAVSSPFPRPGAVAVPGPMPGRQYSYRSQPPILGGTEGSNAMTIVARNEPDNNVSICENDSSTMLTVGVTPVHGEGNNSSNSTMQSTSAPVAIGVDFDDEISSNAPSSNESSRQEQSMDSTANAKNRKQKQRIYGFFGLGLLVAIIIVVVIVVVGGIGGDNSSVDNLPPSPTISPEEIHVDFVTVSVVLQLDDKPEETSWVLSCRGNLTYINSPKYNNDIDTNHLVVFTTNATLLKDGSSDNSEEDNCMFTLFDSGSDGISNGFYEIFIGKDISNYDNVVTYSNASTTDFTDILEAPFALKSTIENSPTSLPTTLQPTLEFSDELIISLQVWVQLDSYPEHIGWDLGCSLGGNEYVTIAKVLPRSYFGRPNELVKGEFKVPENSDCKFRIIDTFGNGLTQGIIGGENTYGFYFVSDGTAIGAPESLFALQTNFVGEEDTSTFNAVKQTYCSTPLNTVNCIPLSVYVQLDDYSSETAWTLQCGDVLFGIPPLVYSGTHKPEGQTNEFVKTVYIKDGTECVFTMLDIAGDGFTYGTVSGEDGEIPVIAGYYALFQGEEKDLFDEKENLLFAELAFTDRMESTTVTISTPALPSTRDATIKIVILLDEYPGDISWTLRCNDIHYAYALPGTYEQGVDEFRQVTETVLVEDKSSCHFVITDSYTGGLENNGFYEIYTGQNSSHLVSRGGQFDGFQKKVDFTARIT